MGRVLRILIVGGGGGVGGGMGSVQQLWTLGWARMDIAVLVILVTQGCFWRW